MVDVASQRPMPQAIYFWLVQEYRVSLFAQHLGTVVPVSRKRLEKIRNPR